MSTPNVEALTIAALLDDADVASAVGTRVYGDRPANATDPMLVVHRSGGPQIEDWLEAARVQIDAWGSTKGNAWGAAAAACAALRGLHGVYDPHGVLTGTSRVMGPQYRPDPSTNRPRYVIEFEVNAHPIPA